MGRVILHADCDNYYASVEEKHNPALIKVPIAVCGNPAMRHTMVMSKNSLAKRAGVITGISYAQAKSLCPNLVYIKANQSKYFEETRLVRNVFLKYTDIMIPYGYDEAWMDLTDTGITYRDAAQIADLIRLEIRYSLELSVSVGISDNLIFSKLGSDYRKPNSTTIITRDNYKDIVWPLPTSALLFVGDVRENQLRAINITTVGDIARADPEKLYRLMGKVGYDIWRFANGDDRSFKPQNDEIGSMGHTITPPANMYNNNEAAAVLYLLVKAACVRLEKHQQKAACVKIFIKDCRFNTITRQRTIKFPTDNPHTIFNQAYRLFLKNYTWTNPLRALGIRVDNLIPHSCEQLTYMDFDDTEYDVEIDQKLQDVTARFGILKVEESALSKEW